MDKMLYPSFTVLLVDDETSFLDAASFALRRDGINNVETMSDSRLVMERLARGGCGVLFLDLTMPHISGKELLQQATENHPDVVVFIITAVNDLQSAVECMKQGARDYILKPLQQDQLLAATRRAIQAKGEEAETASLKGYLLNDSLKQPEAFAPIITISPAMRNLFKYAEAIGTSDLPVLVTGETGAGKELIAQAIHVLSHRPGKYVCVNVAGIDDAVFADTLFGHVRGAFTGAETQRNGLMEEAANGTVFLDEIGDIRPDSQTKLLRLLQEGTFHALGSDKPHSSAARVIVATNRDLRALVRSGAFRKDLYYRLQSHEIRIPPLRERVEDIRILSHAFIKEASSKFGKAIPHINSELYPLLSTYSWPGNIRELRGLLFDAVSRNETDTLSLKYLKERLRELRGEVSAEQPIYEASFASTEMKFIFPSILPSIKDMEMLLIQEALHRTNGNKTQAADLLGLTRATIIKRLKGTPR